MRTLPIVGQATPKRGSDVGERERDRDEAAEHEVADAGPRDPRWSSRGTAT